MWTSSVKHLSHPFLSSGQPLTPSSCPASLSPRQPLTPTLLRPLILSMSCLSTFRRLSGAEGSYHSVRELLLKNYNRTINGMVIMACLSVVVARRRWLWHPAFLSCLHADVLLTFLFMELYLTTICILTMHNRMGLFIKHGCVLWIPMLSWICHAFMKMFTFAVLKLYPYACFPIRVTELWPHCLDQTPNTY